VSQFINEILINFIENCISLVNKGDESDMKSTTELYMFTMASCQILSNIFKHLFMRNTMGSNPTPRR